MNNESLFETYLYLSPKKFIISVIQIKDLKLIHKIELFIENDSNIINFEKLTDFLDDKLTIWLVALPEYPSLKNKVDIKGGP